MRSRIASLEREIQSAETALAALEDELADPSAWLSRGRSAQSTRRHEAAKRAIEGFYDELASLDGER